MQYASGYMFKERATPKEMDKLWATGWRHFGKFFFRYAYSWHEGKEVKVIPLRIKISDYVPSKRYRKIAKQCHNLDIKVRYQPISIDNTKLHMFDLHKQRFKDNIPSSLYNFLHPDHPASIPCPAMECCVYDAYDQLLAVSFFDVGEVALSSVYAMFLPAYASLSLGIYTILCEIAFAQQHQKAYLYLGYAYDVPSFYDYKKRFTGLEYFDWQGHWLPFVQRNLE